MGKKYFSIIGVVVILVINYILMYFINNDAIANTSEINFFIIAKQSLMLPGVFLLMDIVFKQFLSITKVVVFAIAYVLLEFILGYSNNESIVDYNFVIGMGVGLIVTIFLNSLIKKYNIGIRN